MKTTTFRSKQKEHVLQLECIAWFRNDIARKTLGVIVPVVNEATYKNANHVIHEGASDLYCVLMDKVIFVELKTATGKQRDAQILFEKEVTKLGHKYKIIRSLEEFKEFVYENL